MSVYAENEIGVWEKFADMNALAAPFSSRLQCPSPPETKTRATLPLVTSLFEHERLLGDKVRRQLDLGNPMPKLKSA
jgi:hypothetical protein